MPSVGQRWRTPASMVVAITALSGGSATKMFGSEQGASGSAHVSSIAVGTRMPWLQFAYSDVAGTGANVTPSAGLVRAKRCEPASSGANPLRSSMRTRACW